MRLAPLLLIYLLAASILSLAVFSQAAGCCINPGADPQRVCSEILQPLNQCCPTPKSNFPNYYKTDIGGPSTEQQCQTQFFFAGQSCEDQAQCEVGCCCSTSAGRQTQKFECTAPQQFFAGNDDCNIKCGVPQCNDGIDNDNNGCKDFPVDSGCANQFDANETGGTCLTIAGPSCDNINYVPAVKTLLVKPVKGEKQLKLTWENECTSTLISNNIYRCLGSSCSDFELIGSTPFDTFIDSDPLLKFGQAYNYKVEAKFSVQSAKPTAIASAIMGDLECWNQFTNNNFCIHSPYYNKYKQYLITSVAGFSEANFVKNVESTFSSKLNKPYSCDAINKLVAQEPVCSLNEVCIITSNTPSCVVKSDCAPDEENLFGLFFTQETCEDGKYCFFDRSVSAVNACYACNPAMSCYDYKSQQTCERDNCRVQNCEWAPISIELGTGVCFDPDEDNCQWCDKPGTEGVKSASGMSSIFEQCTEPKADLLSTLGNLCYFHEPSAIAKNCKFVKCTDYTIDECLSVVPQYDQFNQISQGSTDKCGIGTCQVFNTVCKKNANRDIHADCQNDECEADVFAPNSTLVPILDKGLLKSLSIQIYDKSSGTSVPTLRTTSNYKTYLCREPCGDNGHPYTTVTSNFNLLVSNLKIFDGTTGQVLLQLSGDQNVIRYYSEDPAKNIGLVRAIQINAANSTQGPVIFRINVSQSKLIEGTYYTKLRQPSAEIEFLEPSFVTSARLLLEGTSVAIAAQFSSTQLKIHQLTFPSNLNPGTYILEINAKNDKGIFMSQVLSVPVVIDDVPPTVSAIIPANGSLQNTNNLAFSITFDSKVTLKQLKINNEAFTDQFQTTDKKTYTATLPISDGNKQMTLTAEDYAGNSGTFTSSFVINAQPLQITLVKPPFNVASTFTFELIVGTDNDATCRYSLDDDLEFDFMTSFDSSGGTLHTKSNFNDIPDGNKNMHSLYVRCNDPLQGSSLTRFDLSVDPEPATIKNAFAFPNPVVEEPRITTLKAESNKDTICKYSTNDVTFDSMEGTFDGFANNSYSKVNRKDVQVPGDGNFNYYVICKSKSGILSASSQISVQANTALPLTIKSNTLPYSNTSSITLAIETNKKSQCKYSATDPTAIQGTVFGNASYSHTRLFALGPGSYAYYVTCKSPTQQNWAPALKIEFTIDTTAPTMLFVDDSSSLENYPEFEWRTDRLRVKYNAQENDTKVQTYLYSIEEFGTLNTLLNWTPSTIENEWIWATKQNGSLGLLPGSKYFFKVAARNIVGLTSESMESNGVTIDPTLMPADCTNGLKDPQESDVDCGGPCNLCSIGLACLADSDCLSGFCNSEGICKGPTCDDITKNQDESDTDCGGSKCSKCVIDKSCLANSDCQSDFCSFGICKDSQGCSDGQLSGTESDIDCGGACPTKCGSGKSCQSTTDCLEGAQCIAGSCKICDIGDENCNGIPDIEEGKEKDTDGDGIPDSWELKMGLDPNDPTDAVSDYDNDGLSNLEEYELKNSIFGKSTDPNNADTDEDGHPDKKEVDKGSDPTDPADKPKGILKTILLLGFVVVLLSGLAGGAYYYYDRAAKQKGQKFPLRQPFMAHPLLKRPLSKSPVAKPGESLFERRAKEKKSDRGKLLNIFEKKSPGLSPSKDEPVSAAKKEEGPQPKESIKDEPKKARQAAKPDREGDVFRQLKQINREEFVRKVKETEHRSNKNLEKLRKLKR